MKKTTRCKKVLLTVVLHRVVHRPYKGPRSMQTINERNTREGNMMSIVMDHCTVRVKLHGSQEVCLKNVSGNQGSYSSRAPIWSIGSSTSLRVARRGPLDKISFPCHSLAPSWIMQGCIIHRTLRIRFSLSAQDLPLSTNTYTVSGKLYGPYRVCIRGHFS